MQPGHAWSSLLLAFLAVASDHLNGLMWRLAARSGLSRQLLDACEAQRPLTCCQCFNASACQMDSSAQQRQRWVVSEQLSIILMQSVL